MESPTAPEIAVEDGVITFSGAILEELRARHKFVTVIDELCAEAVMKLNVFSLLEHEDFVGEQVLFKAAENFTRRAGEALRDAGHDDLATIVTSIWPKDIADPFVPDTGRLDLRSFVRTLTPASPAPQAKL